VADHFGFDDLVEIIKVLAHTIVYFNPFLHELPLNSKFLNIFAEYN